MLSEFMGHASFYQQTYYTGKQHVSILKGVAGYGVWGNLAFLWVLILAFPLHPFIALRNPKATLRTARHLLEKHCGRTLQLLIFNCCWNFI